jgi:hypothetical protein
MSSTELVLTWLAFIGGFPVIIWSKPLSRHILRENANIFRTKPLDSRIGYILTILFGAAMILVSAEKLLEEYKII